MYYHSGYLVPKNNEVAAEYFSKAAEQDYEYSQFMIGSMYYNGCGVEKDLAKAEYWFNRAAENDEPYSIEIMEHLNESKENSNKSKEHLNEVEELIKDCFGND